MRINNYSAFVSSMRRMNFATKVENKKRRRIISASSTEVIYGYIRERDGENTRLQALVTGLNL